MFCFMALGLHDADFWECDVRIHSAMKFLVLHQLEIFICNTDDHCFSNFLFLCLIFLFPLLIFPFSGFFSFALPE